ncbi:MAG: ABC transporter substrate-binding protein [Planctomycetales bacterium]|nr:ABC transporter substrate-binding protein [Planctomycetales bacterium]
MSTALTGPAAELGLNVRAGVEAAFAETNKSGGVLGRPLRLLALDDGYEPSRTAPNMKTLIAQHEVLAIIGNVGTPTAVVSIPIANQNKVLFFGAYTGAGSLRKTPPDRYVINYRASYAEETAAMVDALINEAGLRPEEIAFFTQRDAYGDAGYIGGIAALKRYGLESDTRVPHGRYERNTAAVENALADILMTEPEPRAVIMVGAYAPCAKFIRLSKEYDFHPLFLNVSFVGAEPLRTALGDQGDGVVVTQVVPHVNCESEIVASFRRALAAAYPGRKPTFGALEGYINARILIRALQGCAGEVTRESIVESMESLGAFDEGLGAPLLLNASEHQACHTVWPTVIRQGEVLPFEWTALRNWKED